MLNKIVLLIIIFIILSSCNILAYKSSDSTDIWTVTLKNGKTVTGTIAYQDKNFLKMKTDLGIVEINNSDIISMNPYSDIPNSKTDLSSKNEDSYRSKKARVYFDGGYWPLPKEETIIVAKYKHIQLPTFESTSSLYFRIGIDYNFNPHFACGLGLGHFSTSTEEILDIGGPVTYDRKYSITPLSVSLVFTIPSERINARLGAGLNYYLCEYRGEGSFVGSTGSTSSYTKNGFHLLGGADLFLSQEFAVGVDLRINQLEYYHTIGDNEERKWGTQGISFTVGPRLYF